MAISQGFLQLMLQNFKKMLTVFFVFAISEFVINLNTTLPRPQYRLSVQIEPVMAISCFHERIIVASDAIIYSGCVKVRAATSNNVHLHIRYRPRYHFDKSSFIRKEFQNGGR